MESENIVLNQTPHNQIKNKIKNSNAKKHVNIDPSKIGCKYIITTLHNNIKYGKFCNNICNNKVQLCDKHLDCKQDNINFIFSDKLCKHVITQKSRELDRKGMVCGNFTFDSSSDEYCKQHISRNNNEARENSCLRSFKVRFYPTVEQIKKLNCYFGCARFTYNKCIENKESKSDFAELRDKYVTGCKQKFLKDVPKEIRAFAIKEFVTNRENAKTSYKKAIDNENWRRNNYKNYKQRNIKKTEMKYKKKKDEQSITINKDSVKINNKKIIIYPSKFSNEPLNFLKRSKKDVHLNNILEGVLYHDIKITKTNTKKYYICFTYDVKIKDKKKIKNNICAIDVGLRTPLTVYSEDKIMEIGSNTWEKYGPLLQKRDELRLKYKKEIRERKYKINDKDYNKAKKDYREINEKIRNISTDFHYKAITKLMKYEMIYIPKLNVKKMLEDNTLNGKQKELLQFLRHGKLIERLKEKCEITGSRMEITTEYMTTKICSRCFEVNNPKSSKTYECSKCNLVADRDINASKNIYVQQIARILNKLL